MTRRLLRSILVSSFALAFAAGPALAGSSHARIVRLSLVQGDVRFTRDVKGDPLTSEKANWEGAVLNLPIRQGYVLGTDHGRAEVEFENGAMAFLSENTVLEFYDLSLNDGGKTTRLVLRQGTASFYVNPSSADYFSVTGGDFTVEADARTNFRLDNFDDGSVVNVTKGHVSVVRKDQTTALAKGQSLSMKAGDNASVSIGRTADADDFDRWVSGREDTVVTATNAAQQYVNSPYYTSGFADLYTYGSWYPVSGFGNCWRPYGVVFGWSPFSSGGWYMDRVFGWSFIGYQPWGWLPYHFGGWIFDPMFGWMWSPSGFGAGFGFGGYVPYRPVTAVFVRSRTGVLGAVPVHPLDARGKTPINVNRAVFPVNGGTLSHEGAAKTAENWKVLKTPPRDALTSNAVTASVAPARVSRTVLASNANGRAITVDRNSSIAYDAREHRFVNTNPAPSTTVAPNPTTAKTADARVAQQSAAVSSERAAMQSTGATTRTDTAPSARGAAPPTAARSSTPPAPARTMTTPAAPRPSGGRSDFPNSGSGRYDGAGRSGGAASGGSARPSPSPAPRAPSAPSAPRASGGSGRPH